MGRINLEKGKAKNPVVFRYRILNLTPDFDKHLGTIYKAKGIPASVNSRLMQICELTMRHFRNMGQMGLLILEKYCEKDQAGQPVGWPEGPWKFESKEKEAQHDQEMLDLFDTKIVLPIEKIPLQNLEFAGLPGATLRALEFMISGLPSSTALPEGVEKPEGYKAVPLPREPEFTPCPKTADMPSDLVTPSPA